MPLSDQKLKHDREEIVQAASNFYKKLCNADPVDTKEEVRSLEINEEIVPPFIKSEVLSILGKVKISNSGLI